MQFLDITDYLIEPVHSHDINFNVVDYVGRHQTLTIMLNSTHLNSQFGKDRLKLVFSGVMHICCPMQWVSTHLVVADDLSMMKIFHKISDWDVDPDSEEDLTLLHVIIAKFKLWQFKHDDKIVGEVLATPYPTLTLELQEKQF